MPHQTRKSACAVGEQEELSLQFLQVQGVETPSQVRYVGYARNLLAQPHASATKSQGSSEVDSLLREQTVSAPLTFQPAQPAFKFGSEQCQSLEFGHLSR